MGAEVKVLGMGGAILAGIIGIVVIALIFSSASKLQSNERKCKLK